MIYTRFSADSRSILSLTKKLAQQSPLFATCTFAIRTSRSLRYLATPKLVLTHTNYGKAGFTQSEFELHALSEVPGTPKMVLSHVKYGKAGCDREITPRLGVCDRDITTLSAHALIGHCLGNSHVTCQKFSSGTHFRTFDLKLVRTNTFSYFRGPQNKITFKFDGLKTKINFRPVLNFALFSKIRKYEIKYRTKICDFTIYLGESLH